MKNAENVKVIKNATGVNYTTPKLVNSDYKRLREHTKAPTAKVGMFRRGDKRRVKGGL